MTSVIYVATGFVAGVIGGLLGTGGCALIMPVLRFGFGFDPAVAVGTTLLAVVFTAASGAVQHLRMKNVDRETALLTGASGILGVILGSLIFGLIKEHGAIIDLIIGIAFIVVSLRMLYEGIRRSRPNDPASAIPGTRLAKGALGSVVGILTGLIGLGGGYALVPSYIYLLRAPVKLAIGTSLAAFVWMAVVGAVFKLFQGVVDVSTAIALGAGAVAGAYFGAKLMARFKPHALKTMFGLLFLYVSLKFILIYFGVRI